MRRHSSPPRPRESGVAVITAMLVVAIATVLAVELAWETTLDLRRTEGLLSREQAQQFGYGAEAYASKLMDEVLRDKAGEPYSRRDDAQACAGFRFELEQGGMTGGVCDLQGRFNLNNLVNYPGGQRDEVVMNQFRRLLNAIGAVNEDVDIEPQVVETIVESTVDWIDPDSTAEFSGAEADAYTSLQPPYRAANFWFTSVSELRSVRGVTPEIYEAVAPFLAALPVGTQKTKINVNTAAVPVLMSLGEDITAANAEQWVDLSATEPFENATDFTSFLAQGMAQYLVYSSSYFALRGLISIGTTQLGMYSLLEYNGQAVVPRLRQFDVVDALPAAVASETEGVGAEVAGNSDE